MQTPLVKFHAISPVLKPSLQYLSVAISNENTVISDGHSVSPGYLPSARPKARLVEYMHHIHSKFTDL